MSVLRYTARDAWQECVDVCARVRVRVCDAKPPAHVSAYLHYQGRTSLPSCNVIRYHLLMSVLGYTARDAWQERVD
eukprot:1144111-Pelagomonas_calceolata.AAC.1